MGVNINGVNTQLHWKEINHAERLNEKAPDEN